MRVTKKVLFLMLALTVLTICSQNASATLERVLPESSYYDGSVTYDQQTNGFGRLYGRIDFAVYDTVTNENEFIGNGGYEAPGDGRYIYAYQIFNDYELSDALINSFSVFGIDGRLLDESSIKGISGQNDFPDDPSDEGVEPSDAFFEDIESKVVWEFKNGYIEAGDHSWLLVFSSDQTWVEGDYELGYEDIFPVEGDEAAQTNNNPEPTTVLLLGTGAVMLLTKKRKKLKS